MLSITFTHLIIACKYSNTERLAIIGYNLYCAQTIFSCHWLMCPNSFSSRGRSLSTSCGSSYGPFCYGLHRLFTSGRKAQGPTKTIMAFKWNTICVVSGVFLIVCMFSVECHSFESNNLNREDSRNVIANDKPFRMNKFNIIWQKAKLVYYKLCIHFLQTGRLPTGVRNKSTNFKKKIRWNFLKTCWPLEKSHASKFENNLYLCQFVWLLLVCCSKAFTNLLS